MKKLISLLLLSSVLIQPVFADQDRRERHRAKLIEKLNLTEEQTEQVSTIMQEQRQKARTLFNETREQIRPQMESLHAETRERLAAILDEQQLQRFDEISQKRREKMNRRFSEGGFGKHGRHSFHSEE